MHMYCAHQQWLIAPEIDYFFGEREIPSRAEIARDRPKSTAVTSAQLSLHVLSHVELLDRQHTITSCETFSILSSMSE